MKIRNGFVYNDEGIIVATLTNEATPLDEREITLGTQAIPVIEKFVKEVNTGTFKPRSTVKEFEKLLEMHEV